jgi:hypothetical protein
LEERKDYMVLFRLLIAVDLRWFAKQNVLENFSSFDSYYSKMDRYRYR